MRKTIKLRFSRLTLRELTLPDLDHVAGGVPKTTNCSEACPVTQGCSPTRYDGCWTWKCPP